jgi:hypothetical protein
MAIMPLNIKTTLIPSENVSDKFIIIYHIQGRNVKRKSNHDDVNRAFTGRYLHAQLAGRLYLFFTTKLNFTIISKNIQEIFRKFRNISKKIQINRRKLGFILM